MQRIVKLPILFSVLSLALLEHPSVFKRLAVIGIPILSSVGLYCLHHLFSECYRFCACCVFWSTAVGSDVSTGLQLVLVQHLHQNASD